MTSIGIDGEGIDQVTATAKPEIILYDDMYFVTSEKHYISKQLTAEIIHLSNSRTSLGRLVTAQTKVRGKILLSGPADTATLQQVIANNQQYGIDLTIVDGALSRLSLASPSITEATILATGAAISAKISQLVKLTKHQCDIVRLNAVDGNIVEAFKPCRNGIWLMDKAGEVRDLGVRSALTAGQKINDKLLSDTLYIYVSGALSNSFLDSLRLQKNIDKVTIVVQDFTKIFATAECIAAFLRKGGKIEVLYKTRLLAITINPTSPEGYVLNSRDLIRALEDELELPVYDVKQLTN
ncbi:MAG: hypothetical protein Q4D14_03250 [Bacteroidales bacterium]|nr:hypothetical protein [Bacteroidales bacterium]